MKLWEGNVFSRVCLSSLFRGGPMSLYITHDALALTIQGHPLLDMRPSLFWDPAPTPRTCSNLFIMKHVRLSSGWFASYWNAFLFVNTISYKTAFQ